MRGRILLPPFFFSNPVDVGSQIIDWFRSGVIWKHLAITLWESILAFAIGSAAGLGYLIQQAEGVFDIAGVFAGMFVLSVFVILIDVAVTTVERRLLVWRPTAADGRG